MLESRLDQNNMKSMSVSIIITASIKFIPNGPEEGTSDKRTWSQVVFSPSIHIRSVHARKRQSHHHYVIHPVRINRRIGDHHFVMEIHPVLLVSWSGPSSIRRVGYQAVIGVPKRVASIHPHLIRPRRVHPQRRIQRLKKGLSFQACLCLVRPWSSSFRTEGETFTLDINRLRRNVTRCAVISFTFNILVCG